MQLGLEESSAIQQSETDCCGTGGDCNVDHQGSLGISTKDNTIRSFGGSIGDMWTQAMQGVLMQDFGRLRGDCVSGITRCTGLEDGTHPLLAVSIGCVAWFCTLGVPSPAAP